MALKEILESNKVPLPPDFDERFKLVIMGLRKDPKFDEELAKFKKQSGGLKVLGMSNKFKSGIAYAKDSLSSPTDNIPATADTPESYAPPLEFDSEDWMGPRVRWFLDAITSPFARVMLRGLFMVIFFVSYLESIPTFGNILSAGLDIMISGSKAVTKMIQRNIPPVIGLLPLPYASLVGMIIAGIYGAIIWPLIAMVSFSRQDFAVAIESFLRAIPPPAGDTIADLFMEGNRLVARLDLKRQKLASDITVAIGTIANVIEGVSTRINTGVSKVNEQVEHASRLKNDALETINTQVNNAKQLTVDSAKSSLQDAFADIKKSPPTTTEISKSLRDLSSKIKESSSQPRTSFEPTPVGKGRKRLSTRRRDNSKWIKTRRTKSVKH